MSNYKYIVISDLDGTLCNSREILSEQTKEYIVKFQEEHPEVLVTFCTGRPWAEAKDIYEQLQLKSYIACLNGSYIYNPHTKHLITSFLSTKFLSYLLSFPSTLSNLVKGALITDKLLLPLESDLPKATLQALEKSESNLVGVKLFYKESDWGVVSELIAWIKKFSPAPRVSIFFYPGLLNIELQSSQLDKSSFVQFISNYVGVEYKNILTFGDNHNDIPMMKGGVRGYALSNALFLLKQEASVISKYSNDEDGVIKELTSFFADKTN
ncbi:HAD superfamily hydrolase Cof [Mycoplasma wenyonii str. Massachusetts]|uniref:HAD superfamily hydrolase Cof n=1 Tax=Mycoplasma wenyonii (strain Massachusetts) TaxID=1197325 RepID=I6YM14_MYCWM|nr:HAD-IIB family hydrolase [Mycoplasma wenyonii]AFN65329.1 HAD superfamily hydrolase Cof [Mycoplasma wenyonii str. Massachusetts]